MNASPLTRKVFTTILAIILISRVAQQCAVAIRDLTRVSIKKAAAGRRDCHVSIIHTDMFVNVDSPLASLARGDTHSFARTRNAKASSPAASAIHCDRAFAAGNAVCRSATALILPGGRITASVASFAACNNAS